MTPEEVEIVKESLGKNVFIIRLNHRETILSKTAERSVMERGRCGGLIRAQYPNTNTRYTHRIPSVGLVRVLYTIGGSVPVVCWGDGDGGVYIATPQVHVQKLVEHYAKDLIALGLGEAPVAGVKDDPRSVGSVKYYGSVTQVAIGMVGRAHEVLKELLCAGLKTPKDTEAYKRLAAFLPIDKLIKGAW